MHEVQAGLEKSSAWIFQILVVFADHLVNTWRLHISFGDIITFGVNRRTRHAIPFLHSGLGHSY
jgi:hypothetical protein